MDLLQTVLVTAFTLGVLIAFHEYGHFWVARRCGIKVIRYSIGFGKPLLRWKDKFDTEYVISALPLGGYVKMLDEREGDVADSEKHLSFNAQPVWQRLAVVAAGPIANLLLAIIVYWLVFVGGVSGISPLIGEIEKDSVADRAGLMPGQEFVSVDGVETPTRQALQERLLAYIGETASIPVSVAYPGSDIQTPAQLNVQNWLSEDEVPDLMGSLGVRFYQPPIPVNIAEVLKDSAAAEAGMQAGDIILEADDVLMNDWMQWVDYVQLHAGEAIKIRYLRDDREAFTTITPRQIVARDGETRGQVGMRVEPPLLPDSMIRELSYSPVMAVVVAAKKTWMMSKFTLESIKKMLIGLISPKNLSGPITIAKVASASAKAGLEAYLSFLALLSVSLAVLNLLPIPVLDGGHIVYCLSEWVTGKPVSDKIQLFAQQIGLFIILGVMILALYNDILRL